MASATLNWGGTILLIIGFALILAATIYAETRKAIDTTFRVIFISGIVLLFLGLFIVIGGHWRIFFPPTKNEVTTITKQAQIITTVPF